MRLNLSKLPRSLWQRRSLGQPTPHRSDHGGRPYTRSVVSSLLVMSFVLTLVGLPLWGLLVQPLPDPQQENRPVHAWAPLTTKNWRYFPNMVEAYLRDRLGLRAFSLELQRKIRVETLGVSTNRSVILGEDDWLFLDPDSPFAGPHHSHPDLPQHIRRWAAIFRDRQQRLAARGIHYLLVIAPEKQSIYPEHLPKRYRRHALMEAQDRLCQELAPERFSLDLRPSLRAAASEREVYFRNDTHWNQAGAFCAYHAILRRCREWAPECQPKNADAFVLDTRSSWHGDLDHMLRRPADWPGPDYPHYAPTNPPLEPRPLPLQQAIHCQLPHLPILEYQNSQVKGPAVALLHDSFAADLLRFLPAHFSHLVCLPTHGFPLKAIDMVKPQIVIQEFAERLLISPHISDRRLVWQSP